MVLRSSGAACSGWVKGQFVDTVSQALFDKFWRRMLGFANRQGYMFQASRRLNFGFELFELLKGIGVQQLKIRIHDVLA